MYYVTLGYMSSGSKLLMVEDRLNKGMSKGQDAPIKLRLKSVVY